MKFKHYLFLVKSAILRSILGQILAFFLRFFANFSHLIFREKSFARPSFVFAENAKNCAALAHNAKVVPRDGYAHDHRVRIGKN